MESKIYSIRIFGKVHGVHFRESTKGVADILKIKGWIKNVEDGTVQMQVKGTELAIKEFLEWCHEGPDRAKVEKVEWDLLNELEALPAASTKTTFLNFDILKS